jgi:hypothetical protein
MPSVDPDRWSGRDPGRRQAVAEIGSRLQHVASHENTIKVEVQCFHVSKRKARFSGNCVIVQSKGFDGVDLLKLFRCFDRTAASWQGPKMSQIGELLVGNPLHVGHDLICDPISEHALVRHV